MNVNDRLLRTGWPVEPPTAVPHLSLCFCSLILQNRVPVTARALPVGYSDVSGISEGTDIPRLQVCCFLSRIRTELHCRQVLGRVLRRMGEIDDQAWLFVLAKPILKRFSQHIADDLPEHLAVVCAVGAPAPEVCSTDGELDNSIHCELKEAFSSVPQHVLPVGDLASASTYQLRFSKVIASSCYPFSDVLFTTTKP